MRKIVKAAAAAGLFLSSSTYVLAQTQNPNADQRPLPPSGENQQPYDKKAEPTNPPPGPAVGSRPIGPPAANGTVETKPETPADKNTGDLKKLDKQGRGGQQN